MICIFNIASWERENPFNRYWLMAQQRGATEVAPLALYYTRIFFVKMTTPPRINSSSAPPEITQTAVRKRSVIFNFYCLLIAESLHCEALSSLSKYSRNSLIFTSVIVFITSPPSLPCILTRKGLFLLNKIHRYSFNDTLHFCLI